MSKFHANTFLNKLPRTTSDPQGSAACKILTFKVNFLCKKLSESFYFFPLKNIILEVHFSLFNFFENFNCF